MKISFDVFAKIDISKNCLQTDRRNHGRKSSNDDHPVKHIVLCTTFNSEGILCDMESKNSSGNEFLIGILYRALTLRVTFTIV